MTRFHAMLATPDGLPLHWQRDAVQKSNVIPFIHLLFIGESCRSFASFGAGGVVLVHQRDRRSLKAQSERPENHHVVALSRDSDCTTKDECDDGVSLRCVAAAVRASTRALTQDDLQ
jgi:hypothetical protein